jgi:RNA polymerase sigma-70 factor, ECF subfamily
VNRAALGDVYRMSAMQQSASRCAGVSTARCLRAGVGAGVLVSVDVDLEREFEERMRESSALAVRVAFSVLRQRQDAEDVAQEAFAKAYGRFSGLRDAVRFRGWIVRTTWRLAIDHWRADRRRNVREDAATPVLQVVDAEELVAASRRAARLWDAIDALPEKLRIVIVLSAMEENDVREVAELLAIPEGTVKSRLFLARKALAEKLQCLANDSTRR